MPDTVHSNKNAAQKNVCSVITTCKFGVSVASNEDCLDININDCKPTSKTYQNNIINVCYWNARSLRNKTLMVREYMAEHNIDIYLFSESWLKDDDQVEIGELEGKDLRLDRVGGGVACLFKSYLKISMVKAKRYKTFESMELKLISNGQTVHLVIVYRPEPTNVNRYCMTDFHSEFMTFLAYYHKYANEVILVGDFNLHINKPHDKNTRKFNDNLDMFNLIQHVKEPTHKDGNVLDLLITRNPTRLIHHKVDELNSDHNNILFQLNLKKSKPPKKSVKLRRFKEIDIQKFKLDLENHFKPLMTSTAIRPTSEHLTELVKVYTCTSNIVDKHAPEIERMITVRNPTPWSRKDIQQAKGDKRRAEKKWRKTRLQSDFEIYKNARNAYNKLLKDIKAKDLTKRIQANKSNSKNMYKAINSALNRKQESPLPACNDAKILADDFAEFFDNKISKIRNTLDNQIVGKTLKEPVDFIDPILTSFQPLGEPAVGKILQKMRNKHCKLDPLPFWLMKDCIEQFLPVITKIINLSLHLGVMPKELKHAHIRPLLKKPNLQHAKENYRPVSNLSFLGKAIESAVILQFNEHLHNHSLHDDKQSAYRQFHSTETLLMKIHNDIMSSISKGEVTMLVILDLSAAFDTIDHNILVHRLRNRYGVGGTALNWFKSYISERTQAVIVNDIESMTKPIKFGVPQGSKLGPILFNSYIAPISKIAKANGIIDEKYADDQQLILAFKPNNIHDETTALKRMEKCIADLRIFLNDNKLSNNCEKTEFMLIGPPKQLKNLSIKSIDINGISIKSADNAKNLGVIFDEHMSFEKHVNNMCKKAYLNIKNISRIRNCLAKEDSKTVVNALVTPHLDYANGLLLGINKNLINKLQTAQNSAARLIERISKYEHITEYRKRLHWLPIPARIEFKILMMAWKAINNQAPKYLTGLVKLRKHTINLRNCNNFSLEIPNCHGTNKFSERSFARSAPLLWNKLPLELRSIEKIEKFKSGLKTYLFRKYYE